MPLNNKKKYRNGESNAQDLQTNVLGKNWGEDLYISDYQGFYKDEKAWFLEMPLILQMAQM